MSEYKTLLTNIRVSALSGLSNRMLDYYATQDLTLYPDYVLSVDKFISLTTQFSTALNQEKESSDLAELDAARDDAYRGLFKIIDAYTTVPTAIIAESAKLLQGVLDRYGLKVVNMAYDDETGMIDSLLGELAEEQYATLIENVQPAAGMIQNLADAEEAFKQAENELDSIRASEAADSPSATSLKVPLLTAINDNIVGYHNAMAEYKDDAFRHIADTINTMIENENALTNTRATGTTTDA